MYMYYTCTLYSLHISQYKYYNGISLRHWNSTTECSDLRGFTVVIIINNNVYNKQQQQQQQQQQHVPLCSISARSCEVALGFFTKLKCEWLDFLG